MLEDEFWQIRDASGGVLVGRAGKLTYKKGDKTISIALDNMIKAGGTVWTRFSHDLVVEEQDEQEDQEEGEGKCISCSEMAVFNDMCNDCGERVFAAFAARKAQHKAEEKAAGKAATRAEKRKAASSPKAQKKQKKQKAAPSSDAGSDAGSDDEDEEP